MKTFLHRPFEDCTNVGQKVRLGGLSLFTIAMLALFILSGCGMWMPFAGQGLRDKSQAVLFMGGVLAAERKITIEAYNRNTNEWVNIIPEGEEVKSDSSTWPSWSTYYPWEKSIVIPSQYYGRQCSSIGEGALVRSLEWVGAPPSAVPLRSVIGSGWYECLQDNPNPVDWLNNCTNSPNVKVGGSADFLDFGWECVKLINEIRQKEGKKRLAWYAEGECEADGHAECNYNQGPHACFPSGRSGQNELPPYPSIESILRDDRYGGIWGGFYEIEKECWEKNPPSSPCGTDGCYDDKECKCGHYVNMVVCPDYKRVACGLYVPSPGLFKIVINFLP